mmetsp:Transcript_105679/g.297239  ORF Transcript_105679/g.297239 Transcript_105679/m.297239 type:complete len:372 (+) Transcript_105679:126-1241(+)
MELKVANATRPAFDAGNQTGQLCHPVGALPLGRRQRRGQKSDAVFFRPNLSRACRKTKLCVFHLRGMCHREGSCDFAHGQAELLAPPDLQHTRLCPSLASNGACHRGSECKFAHSEAELKDFASVGVAGGLDTSADAAAPSDTVAPAVVSRVALNLSAAVGAGEGQADEKPNLWDGTVSLDSRVATTNGTVGAAALAETWPLGTFAGDVCFYFEDFMGLCPPPAALPASPAPGHWSEQSTPTLAQHMGLVSELSVDCKGVEASSCKAWRRWATEGEYSSTDMGSHSGSTRSGGWQTPEGSEASDEGMGADVHEVAPAPSDPSGRTADKWELHDPTGLEVIVARTFLHVREAADSATPRRPSSVPGSRRRRQ